MSPPQDSDDTVCEAAACFPGADSAAAAHARGVESASWKMASSQFCSRTRQRKTSKLIQKCVNARTCVIGDHVGLQASTSRRSGFKRAREGGDYRSSTTVDDTVCDAQWCCCKTEARTLSHKHARFLMHAACTREALTRTTVLNTIRTFGAHPAIQLQSPTLTRPASADGAQVPGA